MILRPVEPEDLPIFFERHEREFASERGREVDQVVMILPEVPCGSSR